MAASVGPALPPHLEAKRKRQREQEEAQAAIVANSTATPPCTAEDASPKRQRVIGPAMPPQSMEESPSTDRATRPTRQRSHSASSSSSDDDFGPAPPSTATDGHTDSTFTAQNLPTFSDVSSANPKLTRDEWMTIAPPADNLGRLDPARPRPRAFNTSKGARGAKDANPSADSSLWNETPEQKRVRLRNEMLGVTSTDAAASSDAAKSSGRANEAKAHIKQHVDQTRGPSLVEQHRERKGAAAEDDDPSGRAFDREKDMGSGMRIGSSQREQMLKKAASSVSSKFSGGGYL